MTKEAVSYGKYLPTRHESEPRKRLNESKEALLKFATRDWEEIVRSLESYYDPSRNATLVTLSAFDKSLVRILELVQQVVPEGRTLVELDAGDYLKQKDGGFFRLWTWIEGHATRIAEENESSLLVIKGFENCHEDFDVLVYELVQGVDTYSWLSTRIPNAPSVLILTDIDFLAYLNAVDLNNIQGYRGRGEIIVIQPES